MASWIGIFPFQRDSLLVVLANITRELFVEISGAGEHAADDNVAPDAGKPALDLVQP